MSGSSQACNLDISRLSPEYPINLSLQAGYSRKLVAFRGKGGMTHGTRDMVKTATELGLKVIVFDL